MAITGLTPLINGNRYGWSEVSVLIDGLPLRDVVAIEYAEEQEKELDYGASRSAKGILRGRVKCTGKITLNTEVVQQLRRIAIPFGGGITRLPAFMVVVNYQPLPGLAIINHVLMGCEFLKDEVKYAEGDMKYDQELELIVKQIKWL